MPLQKGFYKRGQGGIRNKRKKVKLSLLTDCIFAYRENPKEYTEQLLELKMNLASGRIQG